MPPTLAWLYAVFVEYSGSGLGFTIGGVPRWGIFLVVAGLTIGIVPYTLAYMVPTNERLFTLADKVRTMGGERRASSSKGSESDIGGLTQREDEEGRRLVERWMRLNLVRGIMPLVAGLLGIWTVIG